MRRKGYRRILYVGGVVCWNLEYNAYTLVGMTRCLSFVVVRLLWRVWVWSGREGGLPKANDR